MPTTRWTLVHFRWDSTLHTELFVIWPYLEDLEQSCRRIFDQDRSATLSDHFTRRGPNNRTPCCGRPPSPPASGPSSSARRAAPARGSRGWRCHWRPGNGWGSPSVTRWPGRGGRRGGGSPLRAKEMSGVLINGPRAPKCV